MVSGHALSPSTHSWQLTHTSVPRVHPLEPGSGALLSKGHPSNLPQVAGWWGRTVSCGQWWELA